MRLGIAKSVKALSVAAACGAVGGGMLTASAATLVPDLTFGGGDAWRAPFEVIAGDVAGTTAPDPVSGEPVYKFMGNGLSTANYPASAINVGNNERGLAFNATTGNLLLVSRGTGTDRIRILDSATGADKGSLNMTGVEGGTFAMNMIGVADDGVIYMANLTTDLNASAYKVYRWANEAAVPTVAYIGGGAGNPAPPLAGARLGDSFDVIGSGADTRLVAGYGSTPAIPATSGFALFDTDNGSTFTATSVAVTSNAPFTAIPTGEFRLGVTFIDSDTVMGKSSINPATVVDVTGANGTVVAQHGTDGITLRPMDYAVVDGRPLMAMVEASNGQNEASRARIFVYDMTDPSLPLAQRKLGEATALPFTAGGPNQFANGNSVGQVKFGAITGNSAEIFSMSTNNGIQKFTLTFDPVVPPVVDADFNGDLIVDGADFLIWQRGFGLSAQVDKSTGDADGDGNVNDADLAAWKTQFGTVITPPTPVSAVPEPATLGLAAFGMICLAGLRKNRTI
ncbi:DUF4623 domain-containing protein [Lacipirellula parvula]|uniref:Ice-binding protein C-terminal domain-containing protein n=1 Tax=Lacipirellula parvula TaxID=2650471 RepID=A0A5K7XCY9_9BACT|nr:DUF4623 domain-containing protein [Lacipirellula parvula]BBO33867.1 hypothetical protein PLANPX_3479 [Lacipirellula parvula]